MNWLELQLNIVTLILMVLLFAVPIFISQNLKFSNSFRYLLKFFGLSFLVAIPLLFLLAWWIDYSNMILIKSLGYELSSLDYSLVKESQLAKVKQLETSLMGIGWSLQALFNLIFYTLWPTFVYVVMRFAFKRNTAFN